MRVALLAGALGLLSGCASRAAEPPPAVPPREPAPQVAAPAAVPAEHVDVILSASNLERDVFAVLDRLEPGSAGVAMVRAGWRMLLAAQVGERLAHALDAASPVIVGIGAGPAEQAPMVAVAALLPGKRAGLAASYELQDMGGGMQRMVPGLSSPAGNPIASKVECALLQRQGRDMIACARVREWLPRFARFVADQWGGADRKLALQLEVRGKMLQSPDQVLSADLESQAARAGYLTTLELLAAMRDFRAQLELVRGGYELSASFSLRPVADSLAAVLVAPPPSEERLPPAFKQLPADATMAFTSRGVHPDAMAQVADRFWTMMLASMSENQPDPRWAELISLARTIFMRGGALVGAYGHDTEAALAALTQGLARTRPSAASTAKIERALSDYWVLGLEEDLDRVRSAVDGLLELDARGAAARKAAGNPPGPQLSAVKPTRRERLPATAMLLKLARPAAGGTPAEQRYLAVAGSDGWVWLCASRSREVAVERLRGLLGGQQVAPAERLVLLRRPGVRDAVAFGFFTQAALVSMGLPRGDDPAARQQALAELQELADRGPEASAPATLSYGYTEADKGYRRARLTAHLPDGMVSQAPRPETPLALPAP